MILSLLSHISVSFSFLQQNSNKNTHTNHTNHKTPSSPSPSPSPPSPSPPSPFSSILPAQTQRQESSVKWSSVKPPSPERLLAYEALEEVPDDVELNHALLDRVVVCKLNGGLGTTMGCRGPKSKLFP